MNGLADIGREDFTAQLAKSAKLNQKIGHGTAMLEVQAWAQSHQNDLIRAGLYESLIRLTVPK